MTDPVITVRGEHSAWLPAERATATTQIHSDGADRDTVFTHTVASSDTLRALIENLASSGAVTWWTSDQVRVWSERPWNNEGKQLPLVYHSAIDFSVKFKDFDALATWVEAAAAIDHATVGSITWDLTEVTRLSANAEVRTGAVADAVAKATTFAASIGFATVTAVAIADPGMLGDGSSAAGYPQDFSRGAMKAMAFDGGATPTLALKPEEIAVSAAVDARFVATA